MPATIVKKPISGEDFLGIEPELLQQVDPGWLRRLSFFTGRALVDTALTREQTYRAGRLTMLGQAVTPGTVTGLELKLNIAAADPAIEVSPGFGIAAGGEAVPLSRTLTTTLGSLRVINSVSALDLGAFKDFTGDASHNTFTGVLLLQPVTTQVNASAVDSGTGPIEVTGQLGTSCDTDPALAAFEDSQIVDGVRLVLAAWPSTIPLPARDPAGTWRNRLVYAIFNAELALTHGDHLPWAYQGAPLALIGFDTAWKPLFADRSAVVRVGGLPRRRYLLPAQPGLAGSPLLVSPALAQARIVQLAEQVAQTPKIAALADLFATVPPAGALPAPALNLATRKNGWFPAAWSVKVAPIHEEEIETVLDGSMKAAPLDLTKAEPVEVLLPLPDAIYDPNLVVTEAVAPEFQQEADKAQQALTSVLQHRALIQAEANALLKVTGQPAIDPAAGLNDAEKKALAGPAVFKPDGTETFGTQPDASNPPVPVATAIKDLQAAAAVAPYSVTVPSGKLPLFNDADWKDLADFGLPHFIARIEAKLKRADDLLDLGFLTAQTDIYRFRQNVLGATDASRLATSPILANIATGETATATATNLRNYLSSITPAASAAPTPTPPTTTPTAPTTTPTPPTTTGTVSTKAMVSRSVFAAPTTLRIIGDTAVRSSAALTAVATQVAAQTTATSLVARTAVLGTTLQQKLPTAGTVTPSATDIKSQSPLVGAQIDIRTLTVAERLRQSPAQEGLFYAVANRLSILQVLLDLEITIDDLSFVVDDPVKAPAPDNPNPVISHTLAEMRTLSAAGPAATAAAAAIYTAVNNPRLMADTDEAGLFSAGVRVLEQHTQLLRGIEARIAQYRDFLALCSTKLASVQSNLAGARALLTRLDHDLAQARQNIAFVAALLADETARVNAVNARRAQILGGLQVVVYARARTLQPEADVPSRQLVPGNVASPVPACLQQASAIPPELREISNLLRDAPINWLPAVQALLLRLERPVLLHDLAVASQIRAMTQLQLPLAVSSAAAAQGVYAVAIAGLHTANQQVFRTFQTQRATFQAAQIAQLNWSAQIAALQNQLAVADLIAADTIHAEIVNATARIIQQISTVAACLYARACLTPPVDRLQWAEFLRGTGFNLQLQSLAVLPAWNTQPYLDRQQMQLLVDWLFQQIDTSNASAVAYMSDVVRVALLLASHAPVEDIIAGAVTVRVKPVVGATVSLNLPSDRIAKGMYVTLYRAGDLAAQAVVSDLNGSGVSATFTSVFKPDVFLEANDMAHFTTQPPQAPAVRAFARLA